MIEEIAKMSEEVQNILVYVKQPTLKMYIKERIKEHFAIKRGESRYIEDTDDMLDVYQETNIQPFGGGRWYIDIDGDSIDTREVGAYLVPRANTSISVYWFTEYGNYKRVAGLQEVGEGATHIVDMYMGRVNAYDIDFLYRKIVPSENPLKKEQMLYIKKNYTYDVDAVCRLFEMMKEGTKVRSTKAIIDLVGTGGNTPLSIVIKLLGADPKTEQGLEQASKTYIKLLSELGTNMSFSEVYRFMLYNLETLQYIKKLQLEGYYSVEEKEIPDERMVVRVGRLRRFSRSIIEEIHMAQVLNLQMCLRGCNEGDIQRNLAKGIMQYLENLMIANKTKEKGGDGYYRRG